MLVGGGTLAAYSGYQWYDLKKSPDLDYLSQKKELLADLAETIIPATDSPGAREAGVQDYIIIMLRDCTDVKTQNKFIDGLKELEHYCLSQYKRRFQDCSAEEKNSVLDYFEKKSRAYTGIVGKVQNYLLGRNFFATLKQYTSEGYCTSELGATKGLAYIAVPGSYNGCIPLKANQKSWATK
jgi:hypothetical protein